MKSGISLFNKGVSMNLLRRCWPVWTSYLAVLLLAFPISIADQLRYVGRDTLSLDRAVLGSGEGMVYVSFVVGVLVAMVMFSYLYSARSSGMMSSLPIRRETLFITAYLTGILPLLIADALVILLTYAFTAGTGYFSFGAYMQSLAATAMANIAFYSFGVFCAMLTGSIIILPLVYLVLNLTAYVAESAVRALLKDFVYGMCYERIELEVFSPMVALINRLTVRRVSEEVNAPWHIVGMEYLLIYCAAGLLLAFFALLIYRRRHMESATDVVAVPILKPVFKYCMAGGTAVVFAVFISSNFFGMTFRGMTLALLIMLMMFIGAFIGYFLAEMLMQKTVRVFSGKWKGYFISCAVIALSVLAFETDVFGYEKYVPAFEKVESVEISRGSALLKEPENIEEMLSLHRSIIDNKPVNESAKSRYYVSLDYHMTDGSTVSREFYLSGDGDLVNDESSDIHRMSELTNTTEARLRRCEMRIPMTELTVNQFTVYNYWYTEDGRYEENYIQLSAKEALDFYNNYLVHDINAGTMGRNWWLMNDEYYDTMSNVRVDLQLSNRALLTAAEKETGVDNEFFTFCLCLDAEKCMEWLRENTELEAVSIREAERVLTENENIETVVNYNSMMK